MPSPVVSLERVGRRFGTRIALDGVSTTIAPGQFEPIAQLQLANGSLGYRSCLIVHTDSDIFSPEDLGGKTFAFNDPNSTSGYLVPSAFFMMEMKTDPAKLFSKKPMVLRRIALPEAKK